MWSTFPSRTVRQGKTMSKSNVYLQSCPVYTRREFVSASVGHKEHLIWANLPNEHMFITILMNQDQTVTLSNYIYTRAHIQYISNKHNHLNQLADDMVTSPFVPAYQGVNSLCLFLCFGHLHSIILDHNWDLCSYYKNLIVNVVKLTRMKVAKLDLI